MQRCLATVSYILTIQVAWFLILFTQGPLSLGKAIFIAENINISNCMGSRLQIMHIYESERKEKETVLKKKHTQDKQ